MDPTTDVSVPDHIGRYRILALIGEGGMGTVYRAHDPQLDRVVALKVPRFQGSPGQQARQAARFRREAQAAASLWHPHVCPIFDVGEHDGRPFVVMALVEGESLAERLARAGRFESVPEGARLALQVLDALAVVHAAGITHRDIKPGNVLLDAAGRAVLTDFGLARPEEGGEALTSDGVILGTPAYMAPEQAMARADLVGPRTDLYSVGVVLFEALTGRRPFDGPPLTVLHRIVHEDPPPLRAFRADLDPGLEAAVLRALSKDPAARYPRAEDFASALRRFVETGPAPDVPSSTSPDLGRPPQAPPRPRGSLGRGLARLPGDALVMAGAVLLSSLPWTYLQTGGARLEAVPTLALVFFACCSAFVGMQLWQLAEYFHVPQGLFHAVKVGSAASARLALSCGVPPDSRDEFGDTPLIKAAAAGNLEMVKVLLREGASTAVRNQAGQTARDAAVAGGRQDVVVLLDSKGPTAASAVPPPLPRRPRWPMRVPVVAALGVLALLAIAWLAWPHPASREAVEAMLVAGEVSEIEERGQVVIARRREGGPLGVLRPGGDNGRVWVNLGPPKPQVVQGWKARAPDVRVVQATRYFSHPQLLCPTQPEALLILAVPVLFLRLVFSPLSRVRFLFPMLQAP